MEMFIDYIDSFVSENIIKVKWSQRHKAANILVHVIRMHSPREITLPDGSHGVNCLECDGYVYPCITMQAITDMLSDY